MAQLAPVLKLARPALKLAPVRAEAAAVAALTAVRLAYLARLVRDAGMHVADADARHQRACADADRHSLHQSTATATRCGLPLSLGWLGSLRSFRG